MGTESAYSGEPKPVRHFEHQRIVMAIGGYGPLERGGFSTNMKASARGEQGWRGKEGRRSSKFQRWVQDDDLAAKISSLFLKLMLAFEELRVRCSRATKFDF